MNKGYYRNSPLFSYKSDFMEIMLILPEDYKHKQNLHIYLHAR